MVFSVIKASISLKLMSMEYYRSTWSDCHEKSLFCSKQLFSKSHRKSSWEKGCPGRQVIRCEQSIENVRRCSRRKQRNQRICGATSIVQKHRAICVGGTEFSSSDPFLQLEVVQFFQEVTVSVQISRTDSKNLFRTLEDDKEEKSFTLMSRVLQTGSWCSRQTELSSFYVWPTIMCQKIETQSIWKSYYCEGNCGIREAAGKDGKLVTGRE